MMLDKQSTDFEVISFDLHQLINFFVYQKRLSLFKKLIQSNR